MDYYVGFMRRFLDFMQIERCVLVGNSAGGRVAWRLLTPIVSKPTSPAAAL